MTVETRPRLGSRGHAGDERGPGAVAGAAIGIVTTAFALSAGQLVASLDTPASSPLLAVAAAAIDAAPESVKSFAIRTFGENDKAALMIGIAAALALLAAVIGVLAIRRPVLGYVSIGAVGGVGAASALLRPGASLGWVLPSAAAVVAGAAAFRALQGRAKHARAAEGRLARTRRPATAPRGFDRRAFLKASLALSAAAAAGEGAALLTTRRAAAVASRTAVRVPVPSSRARRLPAGAELDVPGLSPFFTPDDEFYRVDTALFVPQLRVEDWRLRIHGMVERPMEIDFRDLLSRPLIERDITLNCVSNEVGGPYVGNARWIGAPLKALLDEAGVRRGATQILSRSSDGMTIGTPTATALDGRDAMLAIAMNGQPLPFEHGFPVRMLVPGLYGYESATKWLVDIELTTLAADDAYWVQRGWAQVAPIKTASRIDTPQRNARVARGVIVVAGVAWAQHRGIRRVEVSVDDGPWLQATLAAEDSIDTWRQWTWSWQATPGEHLLRVRATDGAGELQTGSAAPPFPSGATGWDEANVTVV
jgi:DMSO/TMAO reductase YedYZ molybdopterin-dependent catalytic subunit